MNLTIKRNICILMGILLVTIIKIDIMIPNINILLAIGCFYKAYKVNKLLKNKENKSI
ncbi:MULTISPECIES: hypothetical protein [Romboutsia]|uniref:Uncharacterized protein n=1 Tax=Romboutsia hominis TaxID=1507512 RepID=A0A2P2BTA6_9FIRM|nr:MULTISPECIES: hypothetical protein [Romboutsia]MCH1960825.1 hypothetical protein [Romboutsia hominis]MCH1968742.1 hypothetical protein [Romboutsia hominis]MDB8791331.1 hypothetical protein [Romboutsia sp. 1001216sp1]MDB8793745.1 hypothetical protein [Romboutsia sp. 1001216sp1]MDB8795142.1 hypothetical protein [Romboutsia sp. 1001216sp1]